MAHCYRLFNCWTTIECHIADSLAESAVKCQAASLLQPPTARSCSPSCSMSREGCLIRWWCAATCRSERGMQKSVPQYIMLLQLAGCKPGRCQDAATSTVLPSHQRHSTNDCWTSNCFVFVAITCCTYSTRYVWQWQAVTHSLVMRDSSLHSLGTVPASCGFSDNHLQVEAWSRCRAAW